MKRLIKAETDIETIIEQILANASNYDKTVDKINDFIYEILDAYDDEILDDDLAMELLNKFKDNQDIDVEQEIEEANEEVAAAKSARVMQRKKDFENNILSEQAIIKVPTVYSRIIFYDDLPYLQTLELTGNNNDGVENREDWLDETLAKFNTFGGFNYNDTTGGWMDAEGNIVTEKCTTVDAKCSKNKLKAEKSNLINFTQEMGEKLCQDAIYVEFSGVADFIGGNHSVAAKNIDNYSENEAEFAKGEVVSTTEEFADEWINS